MTPSTRPVTGMLFGAFDLISLPGASLTYAKRGRSEIQLALSTRRVRNDTNTAEFWLVSENKGPWQLCTQTKTAGGRPDQVGPWLEFSGTENEPICPRSSPVRCILEEQAGREALLLTRELQLQRVFVALTAEAAKKVDAKREAARMVAATPPADGAEAWAKQRTEAQAELKRVSRRHAQLEDELSQIQQALEAEAEWMAETRVRLKPRRIEAATAALRRAAVNGDSSELARQLQKGAQIDAVNLAQQWSLQTEMAGKLVTSGTTALLHAVMGHTSDGHDHVACVRQLLAAGANVNTANLDGYTALHVASVKGNKELTELLLAAGASLQMRAGAAWKTGRHPLAIATGSSLFVLEAALPHARRPDFSPTECGLCGKTEAEMVEQRVDVEWWSMPCSEASISQVAASACDDDSLQLDRHIMCGTCARKAVADHSLECGICKDPCIPSPVAWAQKQSAIANDLETSRSLATAAWVAVSQAAAAGSTDHVEAAHAVIESARNANDFLQESSASPAKKPPTNASSYEAWETVMEELKDAKNAAAVVAGRYVRRLMGKRYLQLDGAIAAASEAGVLSEVPCSMCVRFRTPRAPDTVVSYTEGNMRGGPWQCNCCERRCAQSVQRWVDGSVTMVATESTLQSPSLPPSLKPLPSTTMPQAHGTGGKRRTRRFAWTMVKNRSTAIRTRMDQTTRTRRTS